MTSEPKQGYLPEQVLIDAYGNGGFRFADMSHRGSILCLPSGIHAWEAEEGQRLTESHFAKVIAEAGSIEFLLVGTGKDLKLLSPELRALFRGNGISADPMSTGAAIRTYNIMLAEKRPVAAAMLAV